MNTFESIKLKSIVKKVNSLRNKYKSMSDEDLKNTAHELKERAKKESLDSLLPESFALVRETTYRALGKEHYDVQIMSGAVLHQGKISEAKTGEGKTITIYLPAFLNSLTGEGVHVVTVNDYLAKRDATDAKKVFDMLDVSVGVILNGMGIPERQFAYSCDITYVTNSELGFDYLKDHLVSDKRMLVTRGFHYAIIDEIDSILIDEAKTPLIISGPGQDSSDLLNGVDAAVKQLKQGVYQEASKLDKLIGGDNEETGDFIKNEKENQIYLTESGIYKIEKLLGLENYGAEENLMVQKAVNNSLRANYMLYKDKDYIIRDGAIEIIDTFTGRVLPGRRFSDGLHQAIEAKEHVEIQKENLTIASVTFQSFFNKFTKKAGLTGTAMTSAREFKDIYNLSVVEIPTNKPVIRDDQTDLVFITKEDKWWALVNEVKKVHAKGQPILIGTVSIEDSEIVSNLLDKENIPHSTLNAKNEELEAGIIAEAGKFGAVTVATNMAGRGTDIILDEESKKAGGLRVLGTERHDSRRIDNQLKGRSGRQGDPGSSQFFISLEDKVMRVFGEESSLNMLALIASPGQPIEFKTLEKIIARAQEAVENENRLVRENMLKFDETNNEHREQIYAQREDILFNDDIREVMMDFFNDVSDEIIDKHISGDDVMKWNIDKFFEEYFKNFTYVNVNLDTNGMKKEYFIDAIHQMNKALIDMKETEIGQPEIIEQAMRSIILRTIDRNWTHFLSSTAYIQSHIGNESYAQRDPSVEYQKKGLALFNTMIDNTKKEIVRSFLRANVQIGPVRQ